MDMTSMSGRLFERCFDVDDTGGNNAPFRALSFVAAQPHPYRRVSGP